MPLHLSGAKGHTTNDVKYAHRFFIIFPHHLLLLLLQKNIENKYQEENQEVVYPKFKMKNDLSFAAFQKLFYKQRWPGEHYLCRHLKQNLVSHNCTTCLCYCGLCFSLFFCFLFFFFQTAGALPPTERYRFFFLSVDRIDWVLFVLLFLIRVSFFFLF